MSTGTEQVLDQTIASDKNLSDFASHKYLDDNEYDTQYFGFTVQSFTDTLFSTAQSQTWGHLMKMEESLSNESGIPREELRAGTNELFTKMTKQNTAAFDKLEIYMKSDVMHLPEEALLPDDVVQVKHKTTPSEMSEMKAEIEEMHRQLYNSKYVTAKVKQGTADAGVVMSEYRQHLALLKLAEEVQEEVDQLAAEAVELECALASLPKLRAVPMKVVVMTEGEHGDDLDYVDEPGIEVVEKPD